MVATAAAETRWTVDDFLAWEAEQSGRHEFVGGCVYAMAPARVAHGATATGLVLRIGAQLRGPCQVFAEGPMLRVADHAFVPDVWVVCSQPDADATVLDDAEIVVEVLSPSNTASEMETKRAAYLTLPSLVAYVVVDGDSYETWTRVEAVANKAVWRRAVCKAGEFSCTLHGRPLSF